jgi:hypothetical protein
MHDKETQPFPPYFSSNHIRHLKMRSSGSKSDLLSQYKQQPGKSRSGLLIGAALLLILTFGTYGLFFGAAMLDGSTPSSPGSIPPAPAGASPTPKPQRTLVPSLSRAISKIPTPTPVLTVAPVRRPTTAPTSPWGCSVRYAIANQWPGGFQAALTITNTGTTAINGWRLGFLFPDGQTITQMWNGHYIQNSNAVIVSNTSYNASIPSGASLGSSPGFLGTWNRINSPPAAFILNGVNCTVA